MAEASLNSHQLGACPCAVRAHQSGGSADQGLQEEVEEIGVRGWREGCRSFPEIVGCAVFLFGQYMFCIDSGFGISCLGFSTLPQGHLHLDALSLGKVAEASLNGHQLGVCPLAVRAHQGGGSADQRLQEEVEELGVRGW